MANKETIVRKIVVEAKLETLSPLKISTGYDDGIVDSVILKDAEGYPFIPATSLVGVLRNELKGIYPSGNAKEHKALAMLFGWSDDKKRDVGCQSMLLVDDARLTKVHEETTNDKGAKETNIPQVEYRDGVAIEPIRGVAKDKAKYDFEVLEKGAQGTVYMEVTIRQGHEDIDFEDFPYIHKEFAAKKDVFGDIMATVADILTKGIRLGALTMKGFGHVKSVKPVGLMSLSFCEPKAMEQWQALLKAIQGAKSSLIADNQYTYVANPKGLEQYNKSKFSLTMDMAIKSALIIRTFDESEFTDKDIENNVMAIQKKSGKDYVIPGTSVKGVVRHKAYDILLSMLATLPYTDRDAKATAFIDSFMGSAEGKEKDANGKSVKGVKSRLLVDEVYIASENKAIHTMDHSRNRIDRFTGGTIEGALFTDQPIWQTEKGIPTVKMHFEIVDCKPEEAGLMLLILKEFWTGTLPIGGNKGIGRGYMEGCTATIDWDGHHIELQNKPDFTVKEKDGSDGKATLEAYVTALVNRVVKG